MPKKVDRCVQKLIRKGRKRSSAWAICQASQKKKGKK